MRIQNRGMQKKEQPFILKKIGIVVKEDAEAKRKPTNLNIGSGQKI